MTRRNFTKAGIALLAGSAWPRRLSFGAVGVAAPRLTLPTSAQLAWQDRELGLLYSFDLPVAAGDTTGNNASRKTWDPNLYQPRKLHTDQWIEAAKACGAGYAIFTATHFNGFMQWQSDLYPYGLKQTSWRGGKGDVVADFVTSCRKAGIKPGLFFSVHRNVYQHVWDHYVDWGKGRGTPAQERFNRIAEMQTEELCSRYGPLIELWFDAGAKTPAEGGPDLLPIFDKHQPDAVFYSSTQRSDHRWIGNESGYAPYPCWATMPGGKGALSHTAPGWKKFLGAGDPDGAAWSPGMVDVPLRATNNIHNWFWAPHQDHAVESVEHLSQMHLNSVGRNCNFILGTVIDRDGRVPETDIQRLAEFGRDRRRRWGQPIAQTSGVGDNVELTLPTAQRVTGVVIMEDIAHGERIQNYTLAGQLPGGQWRQISRGQSVGHKRIEQFPAIKALALRLFVDKSKAEPRLRNLVAYGGA